MKIKEIIMNAVEFYEIERELEELSRIKLKSKTTKKVKREEKNETV